MGETAAVFTWFMTHLRQIGQTAAWTVCTSGCAYCLHSYPNSCDSFRQLVDLLFDLVLITRVPSSLIHSPDLIDDLTAAPSPFGQ